MRVTSPLVKTPATPKRSGRFFFDGLSTPVRARVAHQDAAGMTLRQELPFLQLHGRLRDEEGREGSLENVSVMVRNGVPSLVLDIRYQGGRDDATVPFLMESTRAMRATHSLLRKAEETESALPLEPSARVVHATNVRATNDHATTDHAATQRATNDPATNNPAMSDAATATVSTNEAATPDHPLFNPTNVAASPRKARRDETLPYGIETRNAAADGSASMPSVETPRVEMEAVEIPSVEDLMRVTGVPSAPVRRRGGLNGWWARLWQRLMFRLFARA